MVGGGAEGVDVTVSPETGDDLGAATRPRWFIRSCLTRILGDGVTLCPWSAWGAEGESRELLDLGTRGILRIVPALASGDRRPGLASRLELGLEVTGRLASTASPGVCTSLGGAGPERSGLVTAERSSCEASCLPS